MPTIDRDALKGGHASLCPPYGSNAPLLQPHATGIERRGRRPVRKHAAHADLLRQHIECRQRVAVAVDSRLPNYRRPCVRRDDLACDDNRAVQRAFISPRSNSLRITQQCRDKGDVMERRHFLKLAFGLATGAVALAAGAQAAPLAPQPLPEDGRLPPGNGDVRPAVATADEVDRLSPEEVRWGRGRGRHGGWRGRRWGWRRRHWGWHRRRWRRRRRYWRRRYW